MAKEGPRFDVVGQLAALRRYARSLTRDDVDAEDLVHDTLLRAYERRSTFKPGRNLRTWLMSILHNRFIDGTRGRRAEAARMEAARLEAESQLVHAQEPAGQDHAVRLAEVRRMFLSLPEEQRAALHLVAIEGFSYEEAALTLGIPVGTLMSRLGRARAALRAAEDAAASPSRALAESTLPRGEQKAARLRIVGGTDDAAE
jgi:RNA polymerase sigma-70 factor (ECF subfamily)